jgi:hypothetical protein
MTHGDDDLVGSFVRTPTQRGRIVVVSRLLDFALVEMIGPDGKPTGRHGVLKTLKNLTDPQTGEAA